MNDEWYQYNSIAIHTTLSNIYDWLQGFLQINLGHVVHLCKFNSDNSQYLGYVAMKAFEIHIEIEHNTPEDIQLTFLANRQTTQVEAHVNTVIQAIHKKWQIATLPYGFVNIIQDQAIIKNLEDRWEESQKTYQAEAWLSTIVLLGSILECILFSVLLQHAKKAYTSTHIPIDKDTNKKLKMTKWKLQTMIEVAKDVHWISSDFKNFSHALREYRNLVHPSNQINMGEDGKVTPAMCRNSRETIRGVIEELSKNIYKTR